MNKRGVWPPSFDDKEGVLIQDLYAFRFDYWRRLALTHSSLARGRRFERLELLGDRVLAMAMTDWLYDQHPKADEGVLSQLLSKNTRRDHCTYIAKQIGLHKVLRYARRVDIQESSVLGNALEAWLGAVYRDGGLSAVQRIIIRLWSQFPAHGESDHKTHLQQWVQEHHLPLPVYTCVSSVGPDHCCVHTVEVVVGENRATGSGSSRKKAEHMAARAFLKGVKVDHV